jgi:DNA-binding NarL/FixJ family response regulator
MVGYYPRWAVADVIIVSDSPHVRADVAAVLASDATIRELTAGMQVLPNVVERRPDLVVLDLQVGNMGAMATCLDLRLEESGGRAPHVPVLMLLDRRADVFLAKRSGAEGWVLKPLDSLRLRKAVNAVLAGGTFHDDSGIPVTVPEPSRT